MGGEFNETTYRNWLSGLSPQELQRHFQGLNPASQARQWRIAAEEMARRGMPISPPPPHPPPAYPVQQPGYQAPPPQQQPPPQQGAYPGQQQYAAPPPPQTMYHPAAATPKKGLPLGIKIGCSGCLGVSIIYAIFFFIFFKSMPNIFPAMITSFHAVSANGWTGVSCTRQKINFKEPDQEESEFSIFMNSDWIEMPAPPESGPMFAGDGVVYLLGRKGEYSLRMGENAAPIGDWEHTPLSEHGINCQHILQIDGDIYYYFIRVREDGTNGSAALYNRDKEEPVYYGELNDIFLAEDDSRNLCTQEVTVWNGEAIMFHWNVKRRSGKRHLYFSRYYNGAWHSEPFEESIDSFDITQHNGNLYILYRIMDIDNIDKNPFRTMKKMQETMGRIRVKRFDGEEWHKEPDLNLKFGEKPGSAPVEFLGASDGETLYAFVNEMSGQPSVWALRGDEWEQVSEGGGGMDFSNMFKGSGMFAFWPMFMGVIVLLAFLSSWMIKNERSLVLILSGRNVTVPTLFRRFGAFAVDWAIFNVPAVAYQMFNTQKMLSGNMFGFMFSKEYFTTIAAQPLAVLLFFIYSTVLEGTVGQTLGKKLFGLRVVRDDLTKLSLGRAALRFLLRLVDMMPMGYAVGAIVVAHTDKFQRVGDLAAGTVIVMDQPGLPLDASQVPPPGPPQPTEPMIPQTPYNTAQYQPPAPPPGQHNWPGPPPQ